MCPDWRHRSTDIRGGYCHHARVIVAPRDAVGYPADDDIVYKDRGGVNAQNAYVHTRDPLNRPTSVVAPGIGVGLRKPDLRHAEPAEWAGLRGARDVPQRLHLYRADRDRLRPAGRLYQRRRQWAGPRDHASATGFGERAGLWALLQQGASGRAHGDGDRQVGAASGGVGHPMAVSTPKPPNTAVARPDQKSEAAATPLPHTGL